MISCISERLVCELRQSTAVVGFWFRSDSKRSWRLVMVQGYRESGYGPRVAIRIKAAALSNHNCRAESNWAALQCVIAWANS